MTRMTVIIGVCKDVLRMDHSFGILSKCTCITARLHIVHKVLS
uniref:Uncharacterized protein n=1 Tax=Anguilla anguilla TaxID=7936 RepID=A0A0E9RYI2_ANGAN